MRSQSSRHRSGLLFAPLLVLLLVWPVGARALDDDFWGIGVGTHLLVVDGQGGRETGIGATVRGRFLWVLGLEMSMADVESSPSIRGVSPFRSSLLIHVVQTDHFHFYLSPGLAGQNVGDALNPAGDSTWYRLGGGVELRLLEGLRLGLETHWTVPGESALARYIDDSGDVNEYMSQALSSSSVSPSDFIGLLPLDRLEFSIGLRYYFR
jgi:hypothetical protein